jgi:Septum formation
MKFTRSVLIVVAMALFAAACSQGNVFELEVGQCFDTITDDLISDVPMKDCDEPHDNEVFAVYNVTEAVLPSAETMTEGCFNRFEDAIGAPYATSIYGLAAITPTNDSWDDGDREVICYGFVFDGPEKMTGTIVGSGK